MRPSGSPKVLEQRRRRALALLLQGYQPFDVARLLQVDRRSVRRWKAAVQTHGELALQAKPSPGRPIKLIPSQTQRLERVQLKGAGAGPAISCGVSRGSYWPTSPPTGGESAKTSTAGPGTR